MKRIVSLLLAFALALSCAAVVHAAGAEEEPVKVRIQACVMDRLEKVSGLYYDNGFYVTPETVCTLTGAELEASGQSGAKFSLFGGLMKIAVDIHTEGDIPLLTYNGRLYISLPHMIRYMGFDVDFASSADAEVHMVVYRTYTVLDSLTEYLESGESLFSWSEAEGVGKGTRYLSAIELVMMNYDSNVFRYVTDAFNTDTVEKEVYLDALYEILETGGTEYITEPDPLMRVFEAYSDISSYVSDATDMGKYFVKLLGSETAEHFGVLNETLGVSVFDLAGVVTGFTEDQVQAMNMFKQYFNMCASNKSLLRDSLGQVPSDSAFYQQLPELFHAAEDAQKMVDGTYETNTAEHAFVNAWKTGFNMAGGTLASTWDLIITLLKSDSMMQGIVEEDRKIAFADISADIQTISNCMVAESFRRIANRTDPSEQDVMDTQRYLKANMTMALKSALTARDLLMSSERVTEDAAEEMRAASYASAKLLNRVINAETIIPGRTPVVDEDLTWIAELAVGDCFGYAVEYDGDVYYWKYSKLSFSDTCTLGYIGYSEQCVNQMIRHSPNGGDTVVFETAGGGEFALVDDWIYYQDFNGIVTCSLDGRDRTELGPGILEGATDDGFYLIYSKYEWPESRMGRRDLYVIDTATGEQTLLAKGAGFIACWDGVIYYQPDEADASAAKQGQMTVSRILPDGTGQADLHTTAPDLYSADPFYTEAMVGQMYFGEKFIYYSYGSIAGSGMFFQGGKIIRMGYDGSGATVVAGEPEQVASDFIVNEDGTLTTCPASEGNMLFVSMEDFCVSGGSVYQYDRASGASEALINPEDYFMVGPGLAGRDGETAIYISQIQRTGGKVYFLAHALAKQDIMWWAGYARQNSAFLAKDLETGDIEVLYTF
ncbi:MAG: hypothetical protein ACI3XJ_12480 [Oscillospiraceae bacterium]